MIHMHVKISAEWEEATEWRMLTRIETVTRVVFPKAVRLRPELFATSDKNKTQVTAELRLCTDGIYFQFLLLLL